MGVVIMLLVFIIKSLLNEDIGQIASGKKKYFRATR